MTSNENLQKTLIKIQNTQKFARMKESSCKFAFHVLSCQMNKYYCTKTGG